MLNELAKDLEIANVHKQIICIIKYFRNTHLPSAWYKAAGGKKFPLPLQVRWNSITEIPLEVRWNSITECLRSYLDNWSKLIVVCEEHRPETDKDIARLINDVSLKRNVEDYLNRMQPIATALDNMHSESCTIADAVAIWRRLQDQL